MDLGQICRMCSSTKGRLKSIFQDYDDLVQTIVNVLQLSISYDDGLPSKICKPCVNVLNKIRENVEQFQEHDRSLRHRVFGSTEADIKREEVLLDGAHCTFRNDLPVQDEQNVRLPMTMEQETAEILAAVEVKLPEDSNEYKAITIDPSDCSESESESDGTPLQPKRRVRKKPTQQRPKTDPGRPKINDHKCYICGSNESLGSAQALLDHLTVHLDMMPHTCAECVMETVVLKNVRSLNVHKKMHAQPIKCEYCDRRYSDYYARDGHVNTYHLGESAPCPSSCEQCGKLCKSIAALKSHMRDHKLDAKCDHCGKIFHRMSKLREHVTRVHEKAEKYNCSLCHHVLHSLESYNSHLKMHNAEKTYACDLCPMKFYTAGNLGLHKKVHAKNANYKPHKDWTSHYNISHDADRGKIYVCNHCGNTYGGSVNTIISHVKHHFKNIPCDRCDLKFTNRHKLKVHYVVHTRERNYRCEHCGKDFMYRTHMNYHIKNKHGRTRNAEEDAMVEPKTVTEEAVV